MPTLPRRSRNDTPPSPDELKTCNRCGETRPCSAFMPRPSRPCGYSSRCRSCLNIQGNESRARKRAEDPQAYKAQTAVYNAAAHRRGKMNPPSHDEKKRLDALARQAEKRYRDRRRKNPAIAKARQDKERHAYRVDAAYRQARLRDVERYRVANPLKITAWRREHYRKNPSVFVARNHRRRARLHGSGGSHTGPEWEALKARYGHRCLRCHRRSPFVQLTRDHVIPISLGGRDDIANLQPLCRSCNARKGVKTTDYRPGAVVVGQQLTLF